MHMTRSPTLQLKKPASIICELEGDARCDQCEKVLFRTCLRVSTSTSILGIRLSTVVSVFSLLNGCSSWSDAEVVWKRWLFGSVIILSVGNSDRTKGHIGLRCLWILNGIMSGVHPDISSPHALQSAVSPLFVYWNPAELITIEE